MGDPCRSCSELALTTELETSVIPKCEYRIEALGHAVQENTHCINYYYL